MTLNSFAVVLGRFRRGSGPSVRAEQEVALYERRYDSVMFWAIGEIRACREVGEDERFDDAPEIFWRDSFAPPSIEDEVERVLYVADVEITDHFHEPRDLDDLRYSLTKIRRFDQPELHFRRSYTSLSSRDLAVIRNGLVDWPRTAVGLLAAELPFQDRLEITTHVLSAGVELSHRELAARIVDYVARVYAPLSELIVAASDNAAQFETWGDVVVGPGDHRDVNLTRIRPDADAFAAQWRQDNNPFELLLKRTREAVFSDVAVDGDELNRILLFR